MCRHVISGVIAICLVLPVLAEAIELEIKSNGVTSASDMRQIRMRSRVERSLYPDADQRSIVDQHNLYRRGEYSSDMEFLIWNDDLASMAEDWAKLCIWEHGQPYRDVLPFEHIGQNLYAYNGTFETDRGIQLWYEEYEFYDYDTGACSKEPCGHYTQVVWSTSREIGCAYNYCPSLSKVDLINGQYLVCNYGPSGNWIGQKPFKKGSSCSQCENGRLWCDDKLCRRDCNSQSTVCECNPSCRNCGTVTRSNCSCTCSAGWTGTDCSETCEDKHDYCGANPGWPVRWCDTNRTYVMDNCPLLCGVCEVSRGQPTTCETTITTPTATSTTTTNTTTTNIDSDISSAVSLRAKWAVVCTVIGLLLRTR